MSGDIMYGTCEVCNKEANLEPVIKYFPIQCICHSPKHFIRKDLCSDCAKKGMPTPKYINIQFSASQLEQPLTIALDIISRLMSDSSSSMNKYDSSLYQPCIDAIEELIRSKTSTTCMEQENSNDVLEEDIDLIKKFPKTPDPTIIDDGFFRIGKKPKK